MPNIVTYGDLGRIDLMVKSADLGLLHLWVRVWASTQGRYLEFYFSPQGALVSTL